MKSQTEIERILEQMGNEWPETSSLVDDVMRDIETQQIHKELLSPRVPLMKTLLAAAAAATILCILWWSFRGSNTLYAQAIAGIKLARSFHMTMMVHSDTDKPTKPVIQSWYERGVGFREEVGSEVRLGNPRYFWTFVQGSELAIRSQSRGFDEIVDTMLSNETLQLLKHARVERFPAGDEIIDGQPCQAYLVSNFERAVDPDWKTGKKRMFALVDDQSRIVRAITETRSDKRWVPTITSEWKYDVPIDPSLFEPHFGDEVKVVDADQAFDELFDLRKAVYREERSGLWYGIHRIERFQGGGILVVSSVRGTEKTLQEFPLTPPRRIQPGLFISDGPAENYNASPQGNGFFRIDLASAKYQGIDVRWWVLVPRGTPPTFFEVAPGKVKLPVSITPRGKYAKAHFANEQGVTHHLTWDIVLDLPEPQTLPTLAEIARSVYADQVALEAVPFKHLDMGAKDNVKEFSDTTKTSPTEFSKAVAAHVRWWMQNDVEFQLEGQFSRQYSFPDFQPQDSPAIGLAYQPTVDDETLIRVAKHESLKRLYLDGTKITDAGLEHLVSLKELRVLSLANTSISDAGIKPLESLSALRELDIQGTEITSEGAARLKAAKPTLRIKRE